jgi:hypothetical protein
MYFSSSQPVSESHGAVDPSSSIFLLHGLRSVFRFGSGGGFFLKMPPRQLLILRRRSCFFLGFLHDLDFLAPDILSPTASGVKPPLGLLQSAFTHPLRDCLSRSSNSSPFFVALTSSSDCSPSNSSSWRVLEEYTNYGTEAAKSDSHRERILPLASPLQPHLIGNHVEDCTTR